MPINSLRRKIISAIPLLPALGLFGCRWPDRESQPVSSSTQNNSATANPGRHVTRVYAGVATTDGAGVRLRRYIGSRDLDYLDPFLLLDEFSSDDPHDYIAGFPPHPHRGMETVTYMLDGRMAHADSLGNRGVIDTGDAQWMTAGSGIIHSEMPAMKNGLLRGLQLWVNLSAVNKMSQPRYRELKASAIPAVDIADGTVRVIAGQFHEIPGAFSDIAGNPLYLDVCLKADAGFSIEIPRSHNAFIYVTDGNAISGGNAISISASTLGALPADDNTTLTVHSTSDDTRFILAAGEPLNEPVARGGPFVMNTPGEIQTAWQEYRQGTFIRDKPVIDERGS